MLESPHLDAFRADDALLVPYGDERGLVQVVGAFEEVGIEYAAIRKGCVLFDMPHTGTIEVRGPDRLSFLNNMITQQVADLDEGVTRRSFWLNRKGRIDADLRISGRADRLLMSVDALVAPDAANTLAGYVFAEDVEIEDASARYHRMALHGVGAMAVLASATGDASAGEIRVGENRAVEIAGAGAIVDRLDITGDPGVQLCVAREDSARVRSALLEVRHDAPGVRPAGWFAINTARVEAGEPIFNTDFGTDTLPLETGVIASRVDFRKGCYLGQEVVARMDARKVRKRGLAAIRLEDAPGTQFDAALPAQGDRVYRADDADADAIGSVTSSTISPMLSGARLVLAMLRDRETAPGTEVIVSAEGTRARGVVQDSLVFWRRS